MPKNSHMKTVLLFTLTLLCFFATAQKSKEHKFHIVNNVPEDPFPKEKSFIIGKVINPLLPFKKGDLIQIHTQTGLRHYRNKKLVNHYKIAPQLILDSIEAKCHVAPCFTTVSNKLVYYVGGVERFIDIKIDRLFVSGTIQKAANTPTKPVSIVWKQAYDLKPIKAAIK